MGLDFTPMDKTLIEYASYLAAVLKPEKIYFVNAQEGLENESIKRMSSALKFIV